MGLDNNYYVAHSSSLEDSWICVSLLLRRPDLLLASSLNRYIRRLGPTNKLTISLAAEPEQQLA